MTRLSISVYWRSERSERNTTWSVRSGEPWSVIAKRGAARIEPLTNVILEIRRTLERYSETCSRVRSQWTTWSTRSQRTTWSPRSQRTTWSPRSKRSTWSPRSRWATGSTRSTNVSDVWMSLKIFRKNRRANKDLQKNSFCTSVNLTQLKTVKF